MKRPDNIKNDVQKTYDAIAPHFAGTREKVWPPTMDLLSERSPCMFGDLGCGAGRALIEAASRGCSVIGVDISRAQVELTRAALERSGLDHGATLVVGDLENLPVANDRLDLCIIVAALHHLPDAGSRTRALNEAYRITKPEGILQVSVWTWDQERFRDRYISRAEGARSLDELDGPLLGDQFVPWKRGVEGMRFYHLYGPGELEAEVSLSKWTLLRSYFDGRNHWVECIKAP